MKYKVVTKVRKSEIPLILFLVYCSYRGFFECIIPNVQTVVLGLTAFIGVYCFLIKKNYKYYPRKIIVWMLLNFAYIVLNGLLYYEGSTFKKGITHYIIFVFVFFFFSNKWDKIDFDKVFSIFSKINILNAIGSIIEALTNNYLLPNSHVQFLDNGRIRTAAFNGDMIALPMILGICVCFEFLHYLRDKRKSRLIYIFLLFLGLFLSQSRGPLVATIMGGLAIFLFDSNRRSKKLLDKKVMLRIMAISFLGIVAFYIFVESPILDNTPLAYFASRIRTIFVWDNSNGDHSNATRVNLWIFYWNYFLKHFWLGIGIGKTGTDLSVAIGSTESGFAKRIVELGFIGTVLNLTFMYQILKQVFNNFKNSSGDLKRNILLCLSIFIAVSTEGLILELCEYYVVMAVLWVGCSYGARKMKEE